MKKIIINEKDFANAIRVCVTSVSKDDTKDTFKRIKFEASAGKVIFYSCDGYSACKVTVNALNNDFEDFDGYVRPIKFKLSKTRTLNVTIERETTNTLLTLPNELYEVTYKFSNAGGYIDVRKLFNGYVEDNSLNVNVDAVRLNKMIKALAVINGYKFNCVKLCADKTQTVLMITGGTGGIKVEQVLMTVKMPKGTENEN